MNVVREVTVNTVLHMIYSIVYTGVHVKASEIVQ